VIALNGVAMVTSTLQKLALSQPDARRAVVAIASSRTNERDTLLAHSTGTNERDTLLAHSTGANERDTLLAHSTEK